MKITYYLKDAKYTNEQFEEFASFCQRAKKRISSDRPFALRKNVLSRDKNRCRQCKAQGEILEVHHIKPVWVYALEVFIYDNPCTISDLDHLYKTRLEEDRQVYEDCHHMDNLITLCRTCHNKTESRARKSWKQFFESNFRVVLFRHVPYVKGVKLIF